MKKYLTIPDLNRLVKFVHELNELGNKHNVGISSVDAIYLVVDGQQVPFYLDRDSVTDDLSLVVSL